MKWTWDELNRDVMNFAKAMQTLNVTEKSAVAIMGFNAPEWAISCLGAIMYNAVFTGVYITNEPDACLYQVEHSEAEIVCCDTLEELKRFTVNLDKLTKVKAFVVWGEKELPSEFKTDRFFLLKDFLKLGEKVADEVI